MKSVFFQVTRHTDSEITSFLNQKAKEGLFLKNVRGNRFVFEEREYDQTRLCSYTFYAKGHELSTEMQTREELVYLRSKGWDCICIGGPENIKDSRRHLYLYEEIKGSDTFPLDPRSEKRAELRGKFKAISNVILCLVYAFALYFLFSTSLVKVVTNTLYFICTVLFSLSCGICLVLSITSLIKAFLPFKKKEYSSLIDVSTLMTFIMLVVFAIFLFLDSLYGNNKSVTERIKVGSSTYKLYKDEIPVDLSSLYADTSGSYRTTKKEESSSFLGSYQYCFDESFGVSEGETVYDASYQKKVSFISYTIFKSDSKFLRKEVSSQLINSAALNDEKLAIKLGVDSVGIIDDRHFIITKNNAFVVIRSGFDITSDNLVKFAELL